MQRLTGAFVSALILFSPAIARADEQRQETVVRVNDIDTSTDRGAERALNRIRRAAQDVCDAPPAMRSYDDRVAARECIQDVMSRAVADLGDPMVAAKFNDREQFARVGERS